MKQILIIWLLAISAVAETPVLIHTLQGENSRTAQFYSPLDYYVNNAEPAIAGNCLGVFVMWNNANSPAVTVSDDKGDSYSEAEHVNGTSYSAGIWIAPNAIAGAHQLDLHFNTEASDITPLTFEIAHCATSNPVDAVSGHESSGTSVTAGKLKPTVSDDMILHFGVMENNNVPAATSMSHGSQSGIHWELATAELLDGVELQYGIYRKLAAINPRMTVAPANRYISIAVALKAADAGGVPHGMYVIREQHVSMFSVADGGPGYPNPSVTQFPCSGNLLVVMANGGSPITSISESGIDLPNPVSYIGTGASESQEVFYAADHICNNSHTFSITPDLTYMGNGVDYDYTVVFYDIAKAAVSPFDTTATSSGEVTSCSFPCDLTGPSLTPADDKEIILNETSEWYNQVTGLTGLGTSDTLYVVSTDSGPENLAVDQENGWSHYSDPKREPYATTWTYWSSTQVQGFWAAAAVAFAPAASP
jgi:hypothetical protein